MRLPSNFKKLLRPGSIPAWILLIKDVVPWVWRRLGDLYNILDTINLLKTMKFATILNFVDHFGWLIGLVWLTVLVFWPTHSNPAAKPEEVADRKTPLGGATVGLAELLHDQFLTQGEGSKFKIEASQTHGGILVSVAQLLDRNKAFRCNVMLVDLKKIEAGKPCATAELHNPDGAFKYGRVFLDLATANNNLFFSSPGSWWLVSKTGPQIRYSWGERRERGSIDLRAGDWVASVEIEVADLVFKRDVKYSWNGSEDLKLVTS